MRNWSYIGVVLALGLAAQGRSAEPETAPSPSTVTPEVRSALANLSSDDYHLRQGAVTQLESALAQQALTLAAQKDPEIQAKLIPILEFDDGLIRWVREVVACNDQDRAAQLQLAADPANLRTLIKVFGMDQAQRVEGVHELAKINTSPEGVDLLLGRMIRGDDRAVALAAMEEAWDRKPSESLVGALWYRAVESGFMQVFSRKPATAELTFRGKPLPGGGGAALVFSSLPDSNIATDVLCHYAAPEVRAKVSEFFSEAARLSADPAATDSQLARFSPLYRPATNAYRMVYAFKPAEIVPALYALATCRIVLRLNLSDGPLRRFASNRTPALAALVALTKQRPEAYQLLQIPSGGNAGTWVVPDEVDENAAIDKLKVWWDKHGHEYVIGPASTQSADRQGSDENLSPN